MTSAAAHPAAPDAAHGRLAHFPVTFFAFVMGLMGLALAIRAASKAFGVGHAAFEVALLRATAVFPLVRTVDAIATRGVCVSERRRTGPLPLLSDRKG